MKSITKIVNGLCKVCGVLSMVLIAVMMLYLLMDVGCRIILKNPLRGTYELVQMAMCVIIFAAFPFVQANKRHIIVSMFLTKFPLKMRTVVSFLTYCFGTFIAGLMCVAFYQQACIVRDINKITDILQLPLYPVYFIACGLMGIFALVLFTDVIKHIGAIAGDEFCKNEVAEVMK